MIAECLTKYDGKWYRAGETLPDSPSAIEVKEAPKPTKSYNKKDISFMKGDDLRALAAELGIDGDHGTKELKALVIEKLGI